MSVECPPILGPETQNCSGRGFCVNALQCVCEPGWVGNGDFAFGAPSCAINTSAIRALWVLVSFVHLLVLFFAIYFLRIKCRQKSRPVGPILMGALILCTSITLSTTGLIRTIDPTRTIGTDPAVTTLFCIGAASFWSGVHAFIYAFIELSIRQARIGRVEHSVSGDLLLHLRISLPLSNMLSFIACLLPFGMLGAKDANVMQSLASSHYIIIALVLIISGFFLTPHFVSKVLKDIEDVASKNDPKKSTVLNQIAWKLRRLIRELRTQAIANVVFAALFGFWPFLQVYGSSYFLPFAWSSAAFTNALGLFVNLPVSDKSTASGTGTREKSSVRPQSGLHTSPTTGHQQLGTFTFDGQSTMDRMSGRMGPDNEFSFSAKGHENE